MSRLVVVTELNKIIIAVQRERIRPAAFFYETQGTAPAACGVDEFNLVGVNKFSETKSPAGTVLNGGIADEDNFYFVFGS